MSRKRENDPRLPESLPPPLLVDDPACADADIDLFFPAAEIREAGRKRRSRANYEHARVYCQGCPERELCLEYAMRHNLKYGMWGGMTPRERSILRQERRKLKIVVLVEGEEVA